MSVNIAHTVIMMYVTVNFSDNALVYVRSKVQIISNAGYLGLSNIVYFFKSFKCYEN